RAEPGLEPMSLFAAQCVADHDAYCFPLLSAVYRVYVGSMSVEDAMSIFKRKWTAPNGQLKEAWVHEYKVGGKRHIKTFATRREAVAFRPPTVEVPTSTLTMADAAEIWLRAVKHGRKDNGPAEYSTLRQYRSHLLHHILPVIADKKLTELTR